MVKVHDVDPLNITVSTLFLKIHTVVKRNRNIKLFDRTVSKQILILKQETRNLTTRKKRHKRLRI